MNKKTLACVTNNMGIGGVQSLLSRVLPLLAEKYTVHLIVYKNMGELFEYLSSKGIHTHVLKSYGRFNYRTIKDYTDFFTKYRVDIVHSHSHSPNIFCPISARLAGVPVCITQIHSNGFHWYSSNKLGRFKQNIEESFVARFFADRIITISQEMYDNYRKNMFVPKDKFALVHNGIPFCSKDTVIMDNLRSVYRIKDNELVLGFVGRLVPGKGLEHVIQWGESFQKSNIDFRIVIIGDGPEEYVKHLKERALRIGDGNKILFIGSRKSVQEYYPQFDALIYTSDPYIEGMPTVILEAASFGLPVLARKSKSIQEIALYYQRIFFSEDFTSISSALKTALQSRSLSLSLSLEHFSIENMANRLDLLYTNLLKEKGY